MVYLILTIKNNARRYKRLDNIGGGKGTRLKKYTKNKPKPLVKIGKSSILENY